MVNADNDSAEQRILKTAQRQKPRGAGAFFVLWGDGLPRFARNDKGEGD